jgi:hypothetical protein
VAWELAIVTAGVLIALAVQQWAEERSWRRNTDASIAAIRSELADHYNYAVEWRTIYPCIDAQLESLRRRLLASGATLDPAPLFSQPGHRFVIRIPTKEYRDAAWKGAIADGTSQRLEESMRRELGSYYAQIVWVQDMTWESSQDEHGLITLAQPIPLDPMARLTLLQRIDQLRGRAGFMDRRAGNLIDLIQKLSMVPPAEGAKQTVQRYGTYRFCSAQRLPMRTLAEAMTAVPN